MRAPITYYGAERDRQRACSIHSHIEDTKAARF